MQRKRILPVLYSKAFDKGLWSVAGDAKFSTHWQEFRMPKEEWGVKRLCPNCSTRFYDLQNDPMTCPSCGNEFDLESLLDKKSGRAAEKKKVSDDDKTDDDAVVAADDDDAVVLDDDDSDDDAADVEIDDSLLDDDDDDDDVPLEEIADVAAEDDD